MDFGAESLTDLLFSFCSQPIPTEGVPDVGELEEEEEDEFEHHDSQIDSPSSSQDGEKNLPKDSGSHPYKASPDFFNVPDIDDTEERPNQSQRTPAPWPQRVRLGKIPDSRATLSGMESALEKAMKKYADKKSEFVVTPEIGQEFDSLAEAYDFYNLYSWEIGFGIKYGQCRRNVEKCKTVQDIVCGCAGKPRRENSHSACCQCPAFIRLHRTSDHGWFIHDVKYEHNHGMAQTCGEKLHWASHRHIDAHAKDIVMHLRNNNISLSKTFGVIASFFGDMQNLPFNKRSLRYLCKRMNQQQGDDDIRKTIQLFSELKEKDPNFVDSVLVDDESKIRALMWTDGKSRHQYKFFGDAITFDTTYRTNQYDMPFGLFVGVNNHFQSIILGGVLLRDETTETFEWVFREFVSLMGGHAPKTILTDQARAMELAIASQWPDTTHRWCKWHVLQKARENLGPVYSKNSDFKDEFHKLLKYMVTVDEFETAWACLIEKYQLEDHPWLTQIYEVREKWAKPYFSGVFCARMTSTQRSESANHMLKNYVQPASSMNNFVRQYQKLMFDRQSEEDFQEKKTRVGGVVLNLGVPLEYHASKVYTAAMYELFQHAIYLSGSFVLQEAWQSEEGMVYVVNHIYAERRQAWSRTQYHVLFDQGSGGYLCECGLYSHMGMLCCHAIRVLLSLGVRKIPEVHIMKRWTKNACEALPEHLMIYKGCNSALKDATYRHSSLYSKALEIVQMGDKNTEAYGAAMKVLLDAISVLSDTNQESDGRGLHDQAATQVNEQDTPVTPGTNGLSGSMNVVSRKRERGRPTNARAKPSYENVSKPRTKFCSICRGRGHKASGCPSYGSAAKKRRKVPKCSKCGLEGHKRNNCSGRMFGVFQ